MNILQHTPLIAGVPPEILLVLALFFTLAALALLVLALEAGHYRDVTTWLRRLWPRRRLRRRWMFNSAPRRASRTPRQARYWLH